MHYLVTGGAGFIGSNLVEALLRRGDQVRALDNFSTGKKENLKDFIDDIELIEGDIRSYHTVREVVQGIEVILHQAALPSVPRSLRDPITTNAVNVGGTLNVLYAAKDAGVKRVVYASSSSVYGNTAELPKHEGMALNPLSPYAVSKLAAEKYCGVFAKMYGLHTVGLRYFNVFGPRQDPTSQYSAVIPKFITTMLAGTRPVIFGDGEQSRDFTFVGNVVHCNLLAATVECEPGLVLNCACHDRTTLNQLLAAINVLLGTDIKPIYGEARLGDVRHSYAAIELAQERIGYQPKVNFHDGIGKTVEWYNQSRTGQTCA